MVEPTIKKDTFSDYVFTVWRKKYLILGVTFVLIVIGIVIPSIKGLVRDRYEIKSDLFINQPPPISGLDYDMLQTPAISFEPLLTSDELIMDVLNRYIEKYPDRKTKLEFFNKRFKVKTKIAEDTSIRRRY